MEGIELIEGIGLTGWEPVAPGCGVSRGLGRRRHLDAGVGGVCGLRRWRCCRG